MCFVTIQNRKRKYLAAIRISLEYILNPYSYTEILMNSTKWITYFLQSAKIFMTPLPLTPKNRVS